MSITSDIRAYADSALEQGKHVVGQAVDQAQHQFTDLRAQAEKTVNLDAIKSAIEPYVAQAKQYGSTVSDRAEGLLETVRSDKRFAKVIDSAEAVSTVVIDTVNDRIIKPLTSRGTSTGKTSTRSTKPANTRPAAKKTAAKKTTAKKSAARKSTASSSS